MLGVAPPTTLRRHVEVLERSTAALRTGTGKRRRYKEFLDGAASWSRVERIIARVEAGPDGTDTRFVVTNLSSGAARRLYERTYCQRGQAENHIKAWKRHLAADRTSCSRATANQFRLMLHTGAYWLMWSLRRLMPKRFVAVPQTLARRPVRHPPPAPAEDRRPGCDAEVPGDATPAQRLPLPVRAAPCPRADAAADQLNTEADAPAEPFNRNPKIRNPHLLTDRLKRS